MLSDPIAWIRLNPMAFFGFCCIGLGILLIALTAIIKTKAEQAAAAQRSRDESKKRSARRRRIILWGVYAIMLLVGVGLNIFGNLLTKRAGEKAAQVQIDQARKERHEEIEQAQSETREVREKLQSILVAMNSAKREDSQKITEEKMRVIQVDLAKWAQEFDANMANKRNEIAKAKAESEKEAMDNANKEKQRQIKASGDAYPILSFAMLFVKESITAFTNRTGKNVRIEMLELPENFYGVQTNYCTIQFSEKAIWTLAVGTRSNLRPPFNRNFQYGLPYLAITFTGRDGSQCGVFGLQPMPDQQKLQIFYTSGVTTPVTAGLTGERDLSNYETEIRSALQPVIEEQLLQSVE